LYETIKLYKQINQPRLALTNLAIPVPNKRPKGAENGRLAAIVSIPYQAAVLLIFRMKYI
jgi:hypothetical protein